MLPSLTASTLPHVCVRLCETKCVCVVYLLCGILKFETRATHTIERAETFVSETYDTPTSLCQKVSCQIAYRK